ncbi:TPR repeat-containing serine/threonine protein kinase [Scytonema sp. HK-05]|uniref:serine/threonine-protein kinase n=1 Tax=Scytonema sp. HK-05 TaxID=1137095 RepID=UPI00093723DF|nr:serine/threonine-protein kinase [Scytonema sp. HK-05]OKH58504.1 protein kinase [Scytonema sp. HK-05]BAY47024.1 TPR repeat-containing serine/threonine protein kinase [Scytonema sp. HK-05]
MLGKTLVGRYQIISHLGGGGFGETFVACDTHLPGSPQCVVKKLKPQANDPDTLQTARRLFDTEAQVLYQLGTHDRIPQLLAYFEENQEFYLVQEFIEGHDLSQEIIPGKPLSQDQVICLLQEILDILEFVHRQKVIHRDINPRNIIRRKPDNKLVLIDFGAVKQITTQVITPNGKTKFTVAIGTPGYIPSEQAQGNPKFSSDIYALGILGIQALTGLSPEQLDLDAETSEIIWQHTSVSEDFAKVLDKMVCYDFRERYGSAGVVLQALHDLNKSQSQTMALSSPLLQNPIKNTLKPITKPKKHIVLKFLGVMSLIGIGVGSSIYIVNAINSVNATELYKQANTLYELQRYQDALSRYEKAVNIRPEYAQARNGQGKTLYELKEYKEALAAYDKTIQLEPDYLPAWSGRGFTLNKLQRYQEAIASFDKALQLQNNYPEVWNAKGEALTKLNEYDQALKSYDKAIEFNKEYYEAWYNKALLLQNLKRYDEAISAYDKVLEFKQDYERAWYNRGNVLVNLQRYQDAIAAYDKAVQYKPTFYQAWLSKGNVLINLQRYPEAIESFEQVIKYNRKNYQAWYGRGWSLHQIKRYEEAVTSYNQAIELNRKNYQVWYNLGNSLYNLKKYQEAILSYNKSVNYEPKHYESWYSRGNALFNVKRYSEAIASYDKAIKIKPDYQQAINARNQAQQQLVPSPESTVISP